MGFADIEDKDFVEMRKNKRIDCFSKIYCIKCICNGDTEEYDGPLEMTLINVSAGGLGIVSDKIFEKGSTLVLRMELEGMCYEKVTVKVVWIINKGDKYHHGLEITNISGRLCRHLSRLDNSITRLV